MALKIFEDISNILYYSSMKHKIRNIDLDDLILLDLLLNNVNVTNAAKSLHVTQPAVSQRLAKMRTVFDDSIYMNKKLTKKGAEIARVAKQCVDLLVGTFPNSLGDGRG